MLECSLSEACRTVKMMTSKLQIYSACSQLDKKTQTAESNVGRIERVLGTTEGQRWRESSTELQEAAKKKAERERQNAKAKLRSLLVSRAMMKDQLHREGKLDM